MPTIDILAAKSWAFYKTNNIMKKEIIKRLTYTFIISLVISMIYSLKKYEAMKAALPSNEETFSDSLLVSSIIYLCQISS